MDSSTSATAAKPSVRHQTALAVIQAYNEWTAESVMAFRASNCIHQVLPKSLGRPAMTNSEWAAYFMPLIPIFRNFHVTVHDLVEDAANNKVSVWASSTATTDVGPYANEYMIILHFNEKGDKVVRFLEFVDSAYSASYFAKLRAHANPA